MTGVRKKPPLNWRAPQAVKKWWRATVVDLQLNHEEISTPQQFEVAEMLNLQAVRDAARERR